MLRSILLMLALNSDIAFRIVSSFIGDVHNHISIYYLIDYSLCTSLTTIIHVPVPYQILHNGAVKLL